MKCWPGWWVAVAVAGSSHFVAQAQTPSKKELVQKVLQLQQAEIDAVAQGIAERPAVQLQQQATLAIRRSIAVDRQEEVARAIDVELRRYVEQAAPLVREQAGRIVSSTVGAALEERMSEDELRQLVAWLGSATNRKYQQMVPEMRDAFLKKLLTDSQPVLEPKVRALDTRIRAILGVAPAASAPGGPASSARAGSGASRPPPPSKPAASGPKAPAR
ncbi:MAG: hypothetical protein ABIO71_11190 [Caldimonas sp.]